MKLRELFPLFESYADLSDDSQDAVNSLLKGDELPMGHDTSNNEEISDFFTTLEGLKLVSPSEIRAVEQKLDEAEDDDAEDEEDLDDLDDSDDLGDSEAD